MIRCVYVWTNGVFDLCSFNEIEKGHAHLSPSVIYELLSTGFSYAELKLFMSLGDVI